MITVMHPDTSSLDIETIRTARANALIGSDLRYLPEVDSTNRVAGELGAGEWRTGTVILTDYQSAGRGRLRRTWIAPPCTSLLSTTLFERQNGVLPAEFTKLAALTVADAVENVAGIQVGLKWPNDVEFQHRKLSGILIESRMEPNPRVFLGIGLNVNFDPRIVPGIPETATSLLAVTGSITSREKLAISLFNFMELWYRVLTQDSLALHQAWVRRLTTIGQSIRVHEGAGNWQGVAEGVQQDGGLIVRGPRGAVRTVHAADVSVRLHAGASE